MYKFNSPYHYSNYNFICEDPAKISTRFINYAENAILRYKYLIQILSIVLDKKVAIDIENSIFEYALTYCIDNNYDEHFVVNIYIDKFNSILDNLNEHSRIQNKYLLNAIINKSLDPKQIAFLQPYQLNPEKWRKETNKKANCEHRKNNEGYSTAYKCPNCSKSKSKITQVQLRSADEPPTIFSVCFECGFNNIVQT